MYPSSRSVTDVFSRHREKHRMGMVVTDFLKGAHYRHSATLLALELDRRVVTLIFFSVFNSSFNLGVSYTSKESR